MAIDISHRREGGIRRVTIKGDAKKSGIGFSALLLAAVIALAIELSSDILSLFSVFWAQVTSVIGEAYIPILCFLTARAYICSGSRRRMFGLLLGAAVIAAHIPYIYFFGHMQISIFSRTSALFPMLMGYAALCVRDMNSIEPNIKNAVILLICLAASAGEGGGLAAVGVYIFGLEYDRRTQIKFFCFAAAVSAVISLILGIFNWQFFNWIYIIGMFIPLPLIKRYSGDMSINKRQWWIFFYPLLIAAFIIIKKTIIIIINKSL